MEEKILTETAEAVSAEPPAEEAAEAPHEAAASKPRKPKFYEITPENDITYRGFLSYRYMKILGWAFLVLASIGAVLRLYAVAAEKPDEYSTLITVLSSGKELSVSLLLFSAFAVLVNGRANYIRAIAVNSAAALGLAALYFFVLIRYVVTAGAALLGSRSQGWELFGKFFYDNSSSGFLSFNIFIDMTMCTLMMFFMNYTPKKHFQGKKIHFFRTMVLLPLFYEIASVCLKILASTHTIRLPVAVFPFLTAKPPMSYLMFLSIARYFKTTELQFLKHGRTIEDYEAYLHTNHSSFRFSKHLSKRILLFAALDLLLLLLLSALHVANFGQGRITEESVGSAVELVLSWGFGQMVPMVIVIPILLLFSYTRTHKYPLIDIGITILGVVSIVLVYFDGLFRVGVTYLKSFMNTKS